MTDAARPIKKTAETVPEIALAFEPIDEHTVLIRLGTALDYRNAERFKTASQAMVQAGARRFILDASHVGVLDSTGLGALFSLQRQIGPKEGAVVLVAPSYPVQTLVNMMRLHKIFAQYRSLEQAQEALEQQAYGDDAIDDADSPAFTLEEDLAFTHTDDPGSAEDDPGRREDDPDSAEDGPWRFFEETEWTGSPPTR